MIEQRYSALKNLTSFQKRLNGAVNSGRYISRFVWFNYIAGAITFSLISAFVILWNGLVVFGGDYLRESSMIFVLFVYALMINVYNALYFLGSVRRGHLVEPLAYSPVARPESILMRCYLKYYASLSFFITMPGTIFLAMRTGSTAVIPLALAWTAGMTLFSWPIGVLISYRSGRPRRKLGFIDPIFRIFSFAVSLAALEVILFLPQLIPSLLPNLPSPVSLALFPINIAYILQGTFVSSSLPLMGIAATSLYLVFFIAAVYLTLNYLGRRIRAGGLDQTVGPRKGSYYSEPVPRALERKDRKILLRDTQVATLIAIPIIVAIPTVFPVFLPPSGVNANPLGIYYLLLSVTAVCAAFYPSILLISESGSFSIWRQLPVFPVAMLRSKLKLALKMFLIVVIPLMAAALLRSGSSIPFYLSISAGLVSGFVFLSIVNTRYLYGKIPREAERVNLDTFGGNLGMLLLFSTSIILLVIPIVAGNFIAVALPVSASLKGLMNSIIDSIINVLMMVGAVHYLGRLGG